MWVFLLGRRLFTPKEKFQGRSPKKMFLPGRDFHSEVGFLEGMSPCFWLDFLVKLLVIEVNVEELGEV